MICFNEMAANIVTLSSEEKILLSWEKKAFKMLQLSKA